MAELSKRLEKAERYLQKGKPESALDELLDILRDEPGNDSVRQSAADLCMTLNRTTEAAALFSDLFDRHTRACDIQRAVVAYKKLARLRTPSLEQSFQFAQMAERINRRESLDAYESVLKTLLANGHKAQALEVMKRIVAVEGSIQNYHRLGELAAAASDTKLAATAFVSVAILHEKAGEDASESYARADQLDPANGAAALGYGRSLLALNHFVEAARLLEPIANYPSAPIEAREAYGLALLACKRLNDATPFVWEMFDRDPRKYSATVLSLIGELLDANQDIPARQMAERLEEFHRKTGTRREFVGQMKSVMDSHQPHQQFLEYMVDLFNSANREHEYCDALLRLFDIYIASRQYPQAAEALDRAAEVDPYEPGHQKRLEMLRSRIEGARFNAIANRFAGVLKTEEAKTAEAPEAAANEPTVLEDLMLQAEIFLQYAMRSKAMERLERIQKLFPREEQKNEKLHQLYLTAGITPQYSANAPSSLGSAAQSSAAPFARTTVAEGAVDNISRVTEITRNIYRQSNVKSVLFTAVNDIGRHWSASRCVAGLITPGKPPSAAMEYCAPGIKQSEVMDIVRLITSLQNLCIKHGGVVAVPDVSREPELAALEPVTQALNIKSLLAISLMDGDEHVGVLILEQCGSARQWMQTEQMVLRTIAEQVVLAVNNVKLRSLVQNLGVTDEKSGLLKRSSYVDVLLSEVRRSVSQKSPLSVLLFDFGKASALVKELGEPGVESMMQQLGQLVSSHIRQNDVPVRYDKTSIGLILADTTDKNAFFVVDKMRKLFDGVRVPGKETPITATSGIAEAVLHSEYDPVDIVTEVINRAEESLAKAKADGGNIARALPPMSLTAMAS